MPKKEHRIIIEANDETHQAWIKFKGQMVHKNFSDEKLLAHLLDLAEKLRLGEMAKPSLRRNHAAPMEKRTLKNQRAIAAHDRRAAVSRARHCQYPGCISTYALELDHIRPISKGGQSGGENLRVLCRHHNQYRAFQ
ncbi:MAG: hypothetical protein A2X86_02305 [Bdellovibrionales bacterium GWA2_49_15]|nr:MAG: hypothetical protein A2X86_02305 [Bdellovibrionales bacterium GWA2_49_15]